MIMGTIRMTPRLEPAESLSGRLVPEPKSPDDRARHAAAAFDRRGGMRSPGRALVRYSGRDWRRYACGRRARRLTPAEGRMKSDVTFLAADAQEGRAPGTKGIEASADYIASVFKKAGLKPAPGADGYFQPFFISAGVLPQERPVPGFQRSRRPKPSSLNSELNSRRWPSARPGSSKKCPSSSPAMASPPRTVRATPGSTTTTMPAST